LKAVTAGASGFLVRPMAPADLLPHLEKALAGGVTFCPCAERLLLEAMHRLGRRDQSFSSLTMREREVMLSLCQHRSDKNVGAVLGISVKTVHAHLARVFRKLRVHDRQSAMCKFLKGLLEGKDETVD
jgi:DNA-binding NarL/FixJ family response regulator